MGQQQPHTPKHTHTTQQTAIMETISQEFNVKFTKLKKMHVEVKTKNQKNCELIVIIERSERERE